jgi:excisionase family DNA binding protein
MGVLDRWPSCIPGANVPKPQAATPSDFLTPAQAANVLAVRPKTIRRMIARGDLTGYRIAGSRLIRLDHAEVLACLTVIPGARSTRGSGS